MSYDVCLNFRNQYVSKIDIELSVSDKSPDIK